MKTKNLDPIWRALADPTRRSVLDLLALGPMQTGHLVVQFPELCRTGVMKHLDILQDAGLLLVRRDGRQRWNYLNVVPIQAIHERWVAKHLQPTASSMTRLKQHVEGKKS
ncbi:MAG: transcriptional regulator [Planctomycetota bacterium]|nr:MAG: transcriptional regulator [Planctomycetota bacterium]